MELKANESRIMSESCGIANFISENAGKVYNILSGEKIDDYLKKYPQNVRNLVVKIQNACFYGENFDAFLEELSKNLDKLTILSSEEDSYAYLNGKFIYRWDEDEDSESFMGVKEEDFNTDEEFEVSKLEALGIVMKNIDNSFHLFRD